jgi:UDP-glucose 4-epimerase
LRTILVTGGAGFIGSRLCAHLSAGGARVISLDNYFTGDRASHVAGVEYREGHSKNIAALAPETPDLVFHLGEYSRVEKSFDEPATVWDLNKAGTFGVLEYCRERGVKLVYAGSSTKFADGGLGRDQSPYAWTKATNTELVRNYGEWFGLKYAICYFYNVYGAGERADTYGTLIEIFRRQYLEGRPLTVVAPGTQQRIFTHVDDIIEGLELIGAGGLGDEFGLGADDTYSVLEVAQLFDAPIDMLPERPGNRMNAWLNVAKSQALGWKAKRTLPDYIAAIRASRERLSLDAAG